LSEFSDFCLYNKTWWKNCTLAVSIQLYYLVIILHYAPRVYFCLLICSRFSGSDTVLYRHLFEKPCCYFMRDWRNCLHSCSGIYPSIYYNPSWKISWKFFHYAMLNLVSGKPRSSNSWFLFCISGKIVGINIVRSC
jgi:hypothetical protein